MSNFTTILIALTLAWTLFSIEPVRAERIPAADLKRLVFLGTPKIDTYFARETGITGTVHAITQLPGREIAVITDRGIFSFDGTHWTTLNTKQINWPVSAIRLSDECSVIGFDKGIATFRPDGTGGYSQHLLTDLGKADNGNPVAGLTFARGFIFAKKGEDLLVIGPDERSAVHTLNNWPMDIFSIGDEVFVLGGIADSALNRWDWDKQELVNASDLLNGTGVDWLSEATPRSEGGVWIRTLENSVIGFDGSRSWTWPGNEVLAERSALITSIVETSPGELALGTASLGVLLFDRAGQLVREVSRKDGLSGANVKRIGTDGQNGLWIATRQSVARLDLNVDNMLFDEQHGIANTVPTIEIFNGRIYLGTESGLFANASNPQNKEEAFQLVNDTQRITDLYAYQDHLFIAGEGTLTLDRQGNFKTIVKAWGTNIYQPSRFPDLMLACSPKGVQRLERRDGEWFPGAMLSGHCPEVFSIAEAKNGDLWASLGALGIARIHLNDTGGSIESVPIEISNPQDWSNVIAIEDEIYVNTVPMIRWDVDSQTFVVDERMQEFPGEKPYGFREVAGRSPDHAFVTANIRRSVTFPRPNRKVLGSISNIGTTIDTLADCIAYDDDGNAWIGGGFGLILARSPLSLGAPFHPKTRIHKITSIKDGIDLPIDFDGGSPLVLQPWQDSIVIQVEFPEFAATRTVQYHIHMQGLDAAPSSFGTAPTREITNLAPGDYRLQVTAKCVDGITSEPLEIPITLLAHWYERAWAFGLYIATLIIVVFAIVKWSARRLERESLELEKTIAKRTQEVESKNEELQQTTESLTEALHTLQKTQDQLLTTARTAGKAEIATNVLHNVGNVLNSVNVNLATLSSKVSNSNVSRLSKLADLIESQQHDIETFLTEDERGKVVPEFIISMSRVLQKEIDAIGKIIETMDSDVTHIKRIVVAQQTYAKSVGVIQEFSLAELCDSAISILDTNGYANSFEIANELPRNLVMQNDKEHILEIVLNLISNARQAIAEQKPQRGLITLSAKEADTEGFIAIKITDNGVGFDKSLECQLFQHGFTTKKDGHGFGLHASANAARALGGSLTLESLGKGKGATATLTLPLANEPQTPAS